MPLVPMKKMLQVAREGNYAVGAFNPVDYSSCKAIVAAAEELNAPVIVQTSSKTVTYWGHETLSSWMKDIAGNSPVPVVFHLDHCKDLDMIKHCIETGWTSVMIDASSFPFEENLAMSQEVVKMAIPAGVDVEAELGEIGGVEEDIVVDEDKAGLADPDKAEQFCKALDLAAFAPAIGTAHGVYKGEPKISFDLIETIYQRTRIPLALHGGTGLSDDIFKRCIALGCAKVNISTNLKYEFIDGFCDYHTDNPDDYEPLRILGAQLDRMKNMIKEKIGQFGSIGKA